MRTLVDRLHAAFHEPGNRIYRVVQGAGWVRRIPGEPDGAGAAR